MIPTFSYEFVCEELAGRFKKRGQGKVRMVGILFARPASQLAKSEIFPNIDHFHSRSGKHIDFFCAGFGAGEGAGPDPIKIPEEYTTKWCSNWIFSNKLFNDFQREISSRTRWKPSGESDLILANAKYDPDRQKAHIDFSSAITCSLDQMKRDGAIVSVENFFEKIFLYAENASGDDPTWGFSDRVGKEKFGSALIRFVLSLLPKTIAQDIKRAAHFAVSDISIST